MAPKDFLAFYHEDRYIEVHRIAAPLEKNQSYLLFWSPKKNDYFVAVRKNTGRKIITILPYRADEWDATEELRQKAKKKAVPQDVEEDAPGFKYEARVLGSGQPTLVQLLEISRKEGRSLADAARDITFRRMVSQAVAEKLQPNESLAWVIVTDLRDKETRKILPQDLRPWQGKPNKVSRP